VLPAGRNRNFGARLYLPQTGRWISADSVLDGLNRYAYVANNPLRYVDPSGHDKHPVMYAPGSDYAKWREAIIKEYGAEVGTAVLEGVAAIDDAVRRHEKILFLIDYNHVSRSMRPAGVHFYQVNLPYSANNHDVKNYFQAIEKKKFWEYKP
jgi:uncharacterized protein RhaS with RHS repeats